MKKESFVERLIKHLKGGEDAKISRFAVKEEKYLNNQIAKKLDAVEHLEEKIGDQKEILTDMIEHIDVHALTNTETIEDYCKIYTTKIADQLAKIENLEEEVSSITSQIEILRKIKDLTIGE